MPISDLGSHVTVGEEVKSHWGAVNASRIAASGTALVLVDGYSLANLTTDVASVEAAVSGQEDLDNGVTIAAGNRDALRVPLRERVIQFREAVPYRLKGTGYPALFMHRFSGRFFRVRSAWRLVGSLGGWSPRGGSPSPKVVQR